MTTSTLRRSSRLVLSGLAFAGVLAAQVWEVGNRMLPTPGGTPGTSFGSALAIGDFNGDGVRDLAVGAPSWDSATVDSAGAFWVYWGSTSRTLSRSGPYTFGNVGPFCTGSTLAAGDFDGDGRDELAVGSPCTGVGSADFAGIVTVWDYASGTWTLRRDVSEDDVVGASAAENEFFGTGLAVGDFDDDGLDDLAVGVWSETIATHLFTGRVFVFHGHASNWLSTSDAYSFSSPNWTAGEYFGYALAAGDFDNDGHADLAVGAPHRTVSGHSHAGAVEIYRGSDAGLVIGGPQVIDEGDFPTSSVEGGELFGYALAAENFHQTPFYCIFHPATCYTDLAIGVPYQAIGGQAGAGKVLVAYGSAAGLLPATSAYLTGSQLGESSAADDHFGWSLAGGRLDRDIASPADLAVGCPFRDVDEPNSGSVALAFSESGGFDATPPAQFVTPVPGIASYPRYTDDHFGGVVAIGDLDDDGWGDLVVGVPGKGYTDTGVVQVFYGALFADGFESNGTTAWAP